MSSPKCTFHFPANRFPTLRTNPPMDAAIRDDLDIAVGKQQINQHAIIVLGIPNIQCGKHLQGALSGGQAAQQRTRVEGVLDRKSNLPAMTDFGLRNGPFDSRHRGRRERSRNPPLRRQEVAKHT